MNRSNKVIRVKNYINHEKDLYDSLHIKGIKEACPCINDVCLGSSMSLPKRDGIRSKEEILVQAKDFLDQYYSTIKKENAAPYESRWDQIQKEIYTTGTYELTKSELIYGAKLAWRNSVRCIGRIQWSKLQVFDCRNISTAQEMFDALCTHIKYSTNNGNIRSSITIFPARTDGLHDFRVWNSQLISYAGYRREDGSILGDPINVEFTEICTELGWKGKGTRWDILPLVLSANGENPEFFNIPEELILEVPIKHPTLDCFDKLNLKWYALPAVSSMLFDIGGVQFPAAPFNGWYMSTEIGCRDICDTQRLNMLEPIAIGMGLNTNTPLSLWKDKAMVETNVAVLHSFHIKGVTIVDHHSASESFMKHLENEFRSRNGCPADWVWIVPPLSSSATPVFHQEMALYYLKPSFEYQEPAWKTHIWENHKDSSRNIKHRRKFSFKQIAQVVKLTVRLFSKALLKRTKATILYATETGKSEEYANKLLEIFSYAFNAKIFCMDDYDIANIENEVLLVIVASTTGNGDPPENGKELAKNLYNFKLNKHDIINGDVAKLRFAVFALGSSAYPNFCAFGKYMDNLLGKLLGGKRLLHMATGDEMCRQEQSFRKWAPQVFKVACEIFCIDDSENIAEATKLLQIDILTPETVRFIEAKEENTQDALTKCHNQEIFSSKLVRRRNLNAKSSDQAVLLLEFESVKGYKPGDHVGIYPLNRPELVDQIIKRLEGVDDPDLVVELQYLRESPNIKKFWTPHEKLPRCSLRELFMRFLDITTPPSPDLLQYFNTIASDKEEQKKLQILSTDSTAYEEWKNCRFPNLLEVLEEFPSVTPNASVLVAQLNILQPRFYSISSSPCLYPKELHLTVSVVVYQTHEELAPTHYGVCSNYLQDVPIGSDVFMFMRSAPNFHLPNDPSPIILIGPGTGIAPFRGFWQQKLAEMMTKQQTIGKIWLFSGCRDQNLNLYRQEKEEMLDMKVIHRIFQAYSRDPSVEKNYVQDLLLREAAEIYRLMVLDKAHFYICGECDMAYDVYNALKKIIQDFGGMNDNQAIKYIATLKREERYHEDIFTSTSKSSSSGDAASILEMPSKLLF